MKQKFIYAIFLFAFFLVIFIFVVFNFLFYPNGYKHFVTAYSHEYGLNEALVYAIIKTESNFKSDVVSKSGAIGLMQLMPTTARWIASELHESFEKEQLKNPQTNIKYGCYYLNYLFKRFDNTDVVICAYNAGETVVSNWVVDGKLDKSKISFEETKNYLKKVKYFFQIYESKT